MEVKLYKKKPISKAVKNAVWYKFFGPSKEGACTVCSRKLYDDDWHAAHIVAEVKGGETSVSNLQPTCKACNLSCATRNLSDFAAEVKAVSKEPDTRITINKNAISLLINKLRAGTIIFIRYCIKCKTDQEFKSKPQLSDYSRIDQWFRTNPGKTLDEIVIVDDGIRYIFTIPDTRETYDDRVSWYKVSLYELIDLINEIGDVILVPCHREYVYDCGTCKKIDAAVSMMDVC